LNNQQLRLPETAGSLLLLLEVSYLHLICWALSQVTLSTW